MSQKLKKILVVEGITPTELAKVSGLSPATISKINNDDSYIPKDTTKGKIVKAINLIIKENKYTLESIIWGT